MSKHLEVRQKYSAARRIFYSLLGGSKCSQTRIFVFDILRKEQRAHFSQLLRVRALHGYLILPLN